MKELAYEKAQDVKKELDELVEKYRQSTMEKQEEIQASINSLDDKTSTSLQEYKDKSDEIISQLDAMYTKMLDTTEDRIKEQNDRSEKKIKTLMEQIEKASNDNRVRHSDMVLKMQNDQNDIQTRITDLSKEVKEVESQMSVFEKAENMRRQLEEEINSISLNFEKLDGFKVAAEAFNNQFDALVSMNGEAEERLEKFNTARKQIDNLEKQNELLRKQQADREQALWAAQDDANMNISMSVEESRRAELLENAINLAKEHPEDVALLIRTWLMEE